MVGRVQRGLTAALIAQIRDAATVDPGQSIDFLLDGEAASLRSDAPRVIVYFAGHRTRNNDALVTALTATGDLVIPVVKSLESLPRSGLESVQARQRHAGRHQGARPRALPLEELH